MSAGGTLQKGEIKFSDTRSDYMVYIYTWAPGAGERTVHYYSGRSDTRPEIHNMVYIQRGY